MGKHTRAIKIFSAMALAFTVIVYVMGVFITLKFDFSEWRQYDRGMIASIWVITMIIPFVLTREVLSRLGKE